MSFEAFKMDFGALEMGSDVGHGGFEAQTHGSLSLWCGYGFTGIFFSLFHFDLVWIISVSLFSFLLNE